MYAKGQSAESINVYSSFCYDIESISENSATVENLIALSHRMRSNGDDTLL